VFFPSVRMRFTYTELLQVLNADIIAEKVDECILKHASVTVAALELDVSCNWRQKSTYERTKRSRLTQLGFFGLNVMNLLNRT
jgi:hypothetical protein